MDLQKLATSLRLQATLPDCSRICFGTFLQKISSENYRVSPHTFQLELNLDEEEKDKGQTTEQWEEERKSSIESFSSLVTRDRATSIDSTSGQISSESVTMASKFEESLVMQKRGQVESLPVEEDESILEARTRTFVTWINGHLQGKGIHIQNLDSDFENGVVLIKLLETLAHGKRIPGRSVHFTPCDCV